MSKLALYGLLLLNILLLLGGQIVWKQALQSMNGLTLLNVLTSPGVYIGGILYVIATGVWFIILNNAKLSVAYPMQSFAYVLGILAAWMLFNESIPPTRWLGAAVIILGVWLVSLE
jgi:drug/metabolite transporter (DMT)-like permease